MTVEFKEINKKAGELIGSLAGDKKDWVAVGIVKETGEYLFTDTSTNKKSILYNFGIKET